MRNRRRQIEIVLLVQGYDFIFVFHGSLAVEDNVHLVFVWILNRGAGAVGVDHRFAITGYADNYGGIRVSLTEQGFVVAGGGCEIGCFRFDRGGIAIEKGRVDLALVGMEQRRSEANCQQRDG